MLGVSLLRRSPPVSTHAHLAVVWRAERLDERCLFEGAALRRTGGSDEGTTGN
jgi:hypothetical protein